MYNEVDLRDKLIVVDERGKDYRPSLKKLADTARAGADKATGDVKENLELYVLNAKRYEKTETMSDLPYDYLDVRGWLENAREKLVESCEASGYPIELEPDRPVR